MLLIKIVQLLERIPLQLIIRISLFILIIFSRYQIEVRSFRFIPCVDQCEIPSIRYANPDLPSNIKHSIHISIPERANSVKLIWETHNYVSTAEWCFRVLVSDSTSNLIRRFHSINDNQRVVFFVVVVHVEYDKFLSRQENIILSRQ